jgi:hypothetical protein
MTTMRPVGWRLDHAEEAGLRRIAPSQVERLCETASGFGFRCARLDLAGCTGKADLLARCAAAFDLDASSSLNWDSLADCLGDPDRLTGPGHVLVIENSTELRAVAPAVLDAALEVLADVSRDWQARGIPFWVLVTRSRSRR